MPTLPLLNASPFPTCPAIRRGNPFLSRDLPPVPCSAAARRRGFRRSGIYRPTGLSIGLSAFRKFKAPRFPGAVGSYQIPDQSVQFAVRVTRRTAWAALDHRISSAGTRTIAANSAKTIA